jgi:hypothetical protein
VPTFDRLGHPVGRQAPAHTEVFSDLPPRRPPDMPALAMRVIAGGKS